MSTSFLGTRGVAKALGILLAVAPGVSGPLRMTFGTFIETFETDPPLSGVSDPGQDSMRYTIVAAITGLAISVLPPILIWHLADDPDNLSLVFVIAAIHWALAPAFTAIVNYDAFGLASPRIQENLGIALNALLYAFLWTMLSKRFSREKPESTSAEKSET